MEEDFIDRLLEEIKEERRKKEGEAKELLERLSKDKTFLEKWLK